MSATRASEPTRRDLIVEAALRRMTTLGYEGTTIGDIADDLGISKAAVGYYFRRKDDFLTEFVTPVLDGLEHAVVDTDTVEDAVAAYLAVLIEHHETAKWIDTDPAVQTHPELGSRLESINERMVRRITGGSRKGADRVRAFAVLGGVWRPTRSLEVDLLDQQRDEIVRAAMAGY